MDCKLFSFVLCLLFAYVQANFALGRISTRPSAGKRSLRSFPPKYAVIRTAYKDRNVCSMDNMVEIREKIDALRLKLQDLEFQYETCLDLIE